MSHRNSSLTVADVRDQLAEEFTPVDPNDPKFLSLLNQAINRVHLSGKWNGLVEKIRFDVSRGYFTLPYDYATVTAVQLDDVPRNMLGRYFEYLGGGPGELPKRGAELVVIDDGDNWPTQVDIPIDEDNNDYPIAGTLRVYSNALDDGKVVRVYGLDANDNVIVDSEGRIGEDVVLASPYVSTANSYTKVSGFQKPRTKVSVELRHWDGVTETSLAEYPSFIEKACFRRYKLGYTPDSDDPVTIQALCKKRYIPLRGEEDFVLPDNIGALKCMMYAIWFEEQQDLERATIYERRAQRILNEQKQEVRGGSKATPNIQPFGLGVGRIKTHL